MGGVAALKTLVAGLPPDLPASIFIVRHTPDSAPDVLADILETAGPLSCHPATDGEAIRHGRIVTAPPGRHLLVMEDHVQLAAGPRENRWRPAIDPLFRSAAVAAGSRVIGIVLTGLLDDGSSGLAAIKRCGGLAVVQSPDDAEYPQMPENALAAVDADYVLPVREMPALIQRMVYEAAPPPPPVPQALQLEVRMAQRPVIDAHTVDALGDSSDVTCPDCGGVLHEIKDERGARFRCSTGHAYGRQTLLAEKDIAIEQSLWAALRVMEERSRMLERMVEKPRQSSISRDGYAARLEENRLHVRRIRDLLFGEADPVESVR